MKLALTIWNGRIAPVFDVAAQVRLFEVDEGDIRPLENQSLESMSLAERLSALNGWDVQVVICGAMSAPAQTLARQYGMEVHAFVTGTEQEVLQAWREGQLDTVQFAMPGCCRRRGMGYGRQCRQRQGQRRGPFRNDY